jgi:amino acid transporter
VASPGGLYGYATESFGPVVGGIAGTLLWVANSVVPNAAVANLLVDTVTTRVAGGAGLRGLLFAAIYALLAVVNIRGVRSGVRLSATLAVIKIAPLVLLVAVGLFAVHPANLHWTGMPAVTTIGRAAALLFFAFMGVEGALNTSGEIADPARTVPRAILLTLTLVAALYIGLQLVAQGVIGAELPGQAAPLVGTATAVFGPWGTRLLLATTALSAAGFLSADMLGSPRNLYALAARGQLPGVLAAVHPRFKTPAVAVGTYAAACALVGWSGSFRQLVIVGTSGTLLLYLICCLGLLRLRARKIAAFGPPFRSPGGAFVPLAASGIIVWMLSTLQWTELTAAALLVVLSGAAYSMQARRRKIPAIVVASGASG